MKIVLLENTKDEIYSNLITKYALKRCNIFTQKGISKFSRGKI